MLTRLKVNGFKNLVDVDVWFGPFTCIAGANGVGKSNLFDAIAFLSALADKPIMEAALSVREGGRSGDIRSLFHQVGDRYDEQMSFDVEMIIPREGFDDLGQKAEATSTFLTYGVSLRYRNDEPSRSLGSLELTREELDYIKKGDAQTRLHFENSPTWRNSVVHSERRGKPYITTEAGKGVIKIHQDGGAGRARELLATSLPRTALSATNAAESPTATLARREMQSWRMLQLEPSALRQPDEFNAPVGLANNGSHLPATLYHLAHSNGVSASSSAVPATYVQIANQLSLLIDDVQSVEVDRDDRREILTLYVTGRDGAPHPARALSDGTLRFLALSVLALDPEAQGLLCLEEPENGIHPERIPAMLELLLHLATDPDSTVDAENPLRQVVVNTHSPAVVLQVQDESLLLAETVQNERDGRTFRSLTFGSLTGTWRAQRAQMPAVSRGKLLAYLNPVEPGPDPPTFGQSQKKSRRVADRDDLSPYLPFTGEIEV